MGAKHRRKSKPPRRHHASPEAAPPPQVPAAETHGGDTKEEPPVIPAAAAELTPEETSPGEGADGGDDASVSGDGGDEIADSDAVRDSDAQLAEPTEDAPPSVSPQEAKQVLERLFVAMLAARMSPSRALTCTEDSVTADLIVEQLKAQDFTGAMELSPAQRSAIHVVTACEGGASGASVSRLLELASAATFRVEMLEFQIRQAVLDRAGNKSRGKLDVQRVLAKISSSLPEGSEQITAKLFESLLEEKLGISAGSSMLAKVVFARVIGHHFVLRLPKVLACPRSTFFAALEAFVVDRPLSLDSVEGQLRHLMANHADLRASFRALDADGSGSVSVDEFVAFLEREAHMNYPCGVLAAFIRRFDLDGDGSLNYDEFVAFVSPKQFGIQVLTPFGMFYQAADRHELMGDVVAKIKTRMFWMQHNDLFATSTQPTHKRPLKLKVTDHFTLMHHYGTLPLQYKAADPISKVLKNGEMVVLVLLESGANATIDARGGQLPPFEYRLRPTVKRSIPPLLSWSLRDSARDQTAQVEPSALPKPSVKARATKPRGSIPGGGSNNTFGDEDCSSQTSAKTDATGRRSTSSSCNSVGRPSAHVVGRRTAAASRPSRPLSSPQETEDTEKMCSQKGPSLRTQLKAAANVADSPVATANRSDDTALSPHASSSGYEFYEPDGDRTDEDDDEPESRGEGSEHETEDGFCIDSTAGDESAPPAVCVEDATLDWDEDIPPPPYDG